MFSSAEIQQHLGEVTGMSEFSPTPLLHGLLCEKWLAWRRYGARKRYERWIQIGKNQVRKRTYMYAYDRTPKRMEAKRLFCKKRRAEEKARLLRRDGPPVPRLCKYKKGNKRVETKENRHERYIKAKEAGYYKRGRE